jgi:hypothetical protein
MTPEKSSVSSSQRSLAERRNNSSSSHITKTNVVHPVYYKVSNSVGLESPSKLPSSHQLKLESKRRKVVVVGGKLHCLKRARRWHRQDLPTCALFNWEIFRGDFLYSSQEYVPTVFQNTSVIIDFNSIHYEVALWDTAGQDEYARLRPLSYPGSDAFLLCFGIDQPDSFYNITTKVLDELTRSGFLKLIIIVKKFQSSW